MQRLKLQILCNRIATISLNRKIQTNSVLLVKRRIRKVPSDDPGLRNQKVLHEDDTEFLEKLENEAEVVADEADFMNIHAAYDEHFIERERNKRIIGNKITKKKYFSPPPQPSMLTYSERENIKYLNKKDPVEWNVQKLSESFPATPDVIIRILKTNWKATPEKQMKIDKKVEQNWKLLEEGKLDADPQVIEHLKKFVNRRQGISDTLKNKDFYLPEIKDEPVYNSGEFSGILSYYEKLIDKLMLDENPPPDTALVTNGLSEQKNLEIYDAQKEESSLSILHKKIDEERKFGNIAESESFIMRNTFTPREKHKTFEYLQSEVLSKANAKKNLGLADKAILEFTSGIGSHNESKPRISDTETNENVKTEEKKENTWNRIKNQELPAEMLEKETTIRITNNGANEYNVDWDEEEIISRKSKKKSTRKPSMSEDSSFPLPDKNTLLGNETNIGQVLDRLKEPKKVLVEQDELSNEAQKSVEVSDREREARERLYYEKEKAYIQNTPFWNNSRGSREKALAEFEKEPLQGPKDLGKVTRADVSCHDYYPERIEIPKSKRGQGLTFKVNDCYYDDDGEFLYRVPGMTK